jgi:hypothetical protein
MRGAAVPAEHPAFALAQRPLALKVQTTTSRPPRHSTRFVPSQFLELNAIP